MKRILSFCSIGLYILPLTAQSVDEIVAKSLQAQGGVEKLRTIKSTEMDNTIVLQNINIENKTTVLIGKAIRSASQVMGNEVLQAFDGNKAWELTPVALGGTGTPKEMSAATAKSLISQLDPFLLLDYQSKGNKIEFIGTEKIDSNETYHLKVFAKDSTVSELWIDKANGLVHKSTILQNGQETEIHYTGFQVVDGINFPTAMEILNPSAGVLTVTVKKIVLNVTIDTSIFKFPTTNNK